MDEFKKIADMMTAVGLDCTSNGSWNFNFEEIAEWHNRTEEWVRENAEAILSEFNPEIVAECCIDGDQFDLTFYLEYVCQHCGSYGERSYASCHSCERWCDEMSKYPHLEKLEFYDKFAANIEEKWFEGFEQQIVWYETQATPDDIGEGGEHLSWFLQCVYGDEDIDDFIADWNAVICDPDPDAYGDDSDRTCDDCPPEECTGRCSNCYYRTV